MTLRERWTAFERPTRQLFESGAMAEALSIAIVGTAFSTYLLQQLMGWGGLIGVLGALCVLSAASFVARRGAVEWHGLLPVSLLVFVAWCAASTMWSQFRLASAESVLYQLIFAFLAVYLALVRDTIQVVRVVGDVLRVLLALSLAVEILSGLLIDTPIPFLGIQGNLAHLGPIQGVFGTRNTLGLVSLIALVTFVVERSARSVTRWRAVFSIALAVLCALLSRSPVVAVVLVLVLFGLLALTLLRMVRDERRRFWWQVVLALFVTTVSVIGYLSRDWIIDLLRARRLLQVRYPVWLQTWNLTKIHPLTGWGWIGTWRQSLLPYQYISSLTGAQHANALEAYLDVLMQLGSIGLLIFLVLVVLALGRSWLVASNKRSIVYVWSPLVLIALLATSFVESVTLVDYGWLLLVICTVKASQNMSWRSALPRSPARPELPWRD